MRGAYFFLWVNSHLRANCHSPLLHTEKVGIYKEVILMRNLDLLILQIRHYWLVVSRSENRKTFYFQTCH